MMTQDPWETDAEFFARRQDNYLIGVKRRTAMTEYRARGWSYAQIGARFGLTRMRVWQIVNRCDRRYRNGYCWRSIPAEQAHVSAHDSENSQ